MHYQEIVEKMRVDHGSLARATQDKADSDKAQMKNDYETLISQIRNDYQQQKNELREYARKLESDFEQKKRDYTQLQSEFENRIHSLKKDMSQMQSQLDLDRGQQERIVGERLRQEQINRELEKESQIVNNEIRLVEDENLRYRSENQDLKR